MGRTRDIRPDAYTAEGIVAVFAKVKCGRPIFNRRIIIRSPHTHKRIVVNVDIFPVLNIHSNRACQLEDIVSDFPTRVTVQPACRIVEFETGRTRHINRRDKRTSLAFLPLLAGIPDQRHVALGHALHIGFTLRRSAPNDRATTKPAMNIPRIR